jgi:hypothetical protein
MYFLLNEHAVIFMNSSLGAMILSLYYLLPVLVLSQGMSPDVVTYTTLMKAFMRVKRFEKVLRLYIYSPLLLQSLKYLCLMLQRKPSLLVKLMMSCSLNCNGKEVLFNGTQLSLKNEDFIILINIMLIIIGIQIWGPIYAVGIFHTGCLL